MKAKTVLTLIDETVRAGEDLGRGVVVVGEEADVDGLVPGDPQAGRDLATVPPPRTGSSGGRLWDQRLP